MMIVTASIVIWYVFIETADSSLVSPPSTPVGIAEKAVCRSVFLTIWHCILSAVSAELT